MKTSEQLKMLLDYLTEVENSYPYYKQEVERENLRTFDFVHEIEQEPLAPERSKLATKYRLTRLHRRACKDAMEDIEPIYDVLQMPECKKVRNALNQALGKCRKSEKYHENREYKNKVE